MNDVMKPFVSLLLLSVVLLTACPGADTPPAAPKDFSATPGKAQLTLSWAANSESDLKGYILSWQAPEQQAQSKEVGLETSAVIDKLQNGVRYSLTIRAEDKGGQQSPPSATITATPVGETPPPVLPPAETPPSVPTGLQAAAQDSQVTLTWTANPESNLRQYRLRWGTSAALEQSQLIPAPADSYVLRGLTNGTPYFFALEAENTLGLVSPRSATVSATPLSMPMAPSVSDVAVSVVVDGNTVDLGLSKQVRQGMGAITLTIKGSRLATLSKAMLGSLPLTITQQQDDGAKLEGTIPHGATLGEQILLLENDGGSVSVERAVEITKITSATLPQFSPSDTCPDPTQPKGCGIGTPNRPYRTLSKALAVAGTGDTVFLSAGTYKDGETWPTSNAAFPPTIAPNVPDGVTIEGLSVSTVFVEGPGETSSSSALVFANSATVRNLTIQKFSRALVHLYTDQGASGRLLLENLNVNLNFDGLLDFGAEDITVRNSKFELNGGISNGSGIGAFYSNSVTLEGTTFERNTYGFYGVSIGLVNLTDTTFTKSTKDGVFLSDIYLARLQKVTSSENTGRGIYAISSDGYSFQMRSSTLSNNQRYGLEIAGNEFGSWDLGSAQNPGNNTLVDNKNWQLYDNRNENTGVTITAQGNTIGSSSSPSTPTGTQTAGPGGAQNIANGVNVWRIERQGNSITF